jgi:hypothetical protein
LLVKDFTSSSIINLNLHRPNAKLRVKATDITATTTMPSSAKVTYTTQHRTAFNAYTGMPAKASADKVHEYVIDNIYNESDTERTLFSDYFFASEDGEKVTFEIELKNGNDTMKSLEFSDISIKRNHLTTIEGNMLSSGNVDNTSSVTEN